MEPHPSAAPASVRRDHSSQADSDESGVRGPIETTPLVLTEGYTDQGYTLCGCGPRLRDRSRAVFLGLFLIWLINVAKETCNNALPATTRTFEELAPSTYFWKLLPIYGDIFCAGGKGLQIIANHFSGPRWTILFATAVAATGLFICSSGSVADTAPRTLGWGTAQFGAGMLWSSCGRIFANWVDFGGRGRLLAIVFGIGTDGGGGLATLLYSFVTALSWRAPFLLSGGFFLVVGALCAGLLRSSALQAGFRAPFETASVMTGVGPDPLKDVGLLKAVLIFLMSMRCILTIAACTCYASAWGVIVAYIPDYAIDRLGATQGAATRLVSWGSFGAAFSSLISGFVCDFLPGNGVLFFTIFVKLLGVGAGIAMLFLDNVLANDGHHTWAFGICVVLVAISIFYSWTVIVNLFALRYGGPSHAATLQGLQDFLSYLIRIPFVRLAVEWSNRKEYRSIFAFILIAMVIGHICILIFLVIDQRMPPKPKDPDAPIANKPSGPKDCVSGALVTNAATSSRPLDTAYSDEAIRLSANVPIKAPPRRAKERV